MGTFFATMLQIFRTKTFLFTFADHQIITIPTFLILRLFGKKVVLIVHDVIPHNFALVHRKRLNRFLLHSQYRAASVIVTLSEAGRQRLISEFKIRASKIHVIPHGAVGFDRQSKIPSERVLLAFGSIRENKNILKVLEAVKMARLSGLDVKLLVAGGYDGSNPYCQACVTMIREDPSAFIDKIGFVEEADVPDLIAQTNAFILAYSDFDSQSGVAVLAGVNSRPVIATFAGGVRDLQALGLAGVEIKQPVTTATILSAIRILQNPAQPMASRGRDRTVPTVRTSRLDGHRALLSASLMVLSSPLQRQARRSFESAGLLRQGSRGCR